MAASLRKRANNETRIMSYDNDNRVKKKSDYTAPQQKFTKYKVIIVKNELPNGAPASSKVHESNVNG